MAERGKAVPQDGGRAPTRAQMEWLRRGLGQPGGKLPLFTEDGQRINERIVRGCLDRGWAEPWFENPLKPNWLVCKLTEQGRALFGDRTPETPAEAPRRAAR